ncbi:MAG TPA: hypothetical protein VLA89_06445 [Gemmatimonadales bacterium]|nr:hypothetical protein [Gemmatimonadales bacterium]
MANEVTTTSVTETIYTTIITDRILRELRPLNVCRPFFRMGEPGASTSYDFTKLDDLAPTNVETPAEAADLTNRDVTTASVRATATVKAIMSSITDLAQKVSILDVLPEVQGVLARTMAEKFETDLAANLANFSNVSDAGATLDVATFLAAIAALEQRDVTQSLVSVIHPKQQGQVRSNIQSLTTQYWGREGAPSLAEYHPNGYVGALFGVPIYQTSVVPTSDAAANRAGAVFVPGEALGLLELWTVKTEMERDASKLLTEVVLSTAYGTVEIDDLRGQTLKSDV